MDSFYVRYQHLPHSDVKAVLDRCWNFETNAFDKDRATAELEYLSRYGNVTSPAQICPSQQAAASHGIRNVHPTFHPPEMQKESDVYIVAQQPLSNDAKDDEMRDIVDLTTGTDREIPPGSTSHHDAEMKDEIRREEELEWLREVFPSLADVVESVYHAAPDAQTAITKLQEMSGNNVIGDVSFQEVGSSSQGEGQNPELVRQELARQFPDTPKDVRNRVVAAHCADLDACIAEMIEYCGVSVSQSASDQNSVREKLLQNFPGVQHARISQVMEQHDNDLDACTAQLLHEQVAEPVCADRVQVREDLIQRFPRVPAYIIDIQIDKNGAVLDACIADLLQNEPLAKHSDNEILYNLHLQDKPLLQTLSKHKDRELFQRVLKTRSKVHKELSDKELVACIPTAERIAAAVFYYGGNNTEAVKTLLDDGAIHLPPLKDLCVGKESLSHCPTAGSCNLKTAVVPLPPPPEHLRLQSQTLLPDELFSNGVQSSPNSPVPSAPPLPSQSSHANQNSASIDLLLPSGHGIASTSESISDLQLLRQAVVPSVPDQYINIMYHFSEGDVKETLETMVVNGMELVPESTLVVMYGIQVKQSESDRVWVWDASCDSWVEGTKLNHWFTPKGTAHQIKVASSQSTLTVLEAGVWPWYPNSVPPEPPTCDITVPPPRAPRRSKSKSRKKTKESETTVNCSPDPHRRHHIQSLPARTPNLSHLHGTEMHDATQQLYEELHRPIDALKKQISMLMKVKNSSNTNQRQRATEQIRVAQQELKTLQKQVSDRMYRARNYAEAAVCDYHGLSVASALERLELKLKHVASNPDPVRKILIIITGRGAHSQGNVPAIFNGVQGRLRTAVQEKEYNMVFSSACGAVVVEFFPDDMVPIPLTNSDVKEIMDRHNPRPRTENRPSRSASRTKASMNTMGNDWEPSVPRRLDRGHSGVRGRSCTRA